MPAIKLSVPHKLSTNEAKQRITKLIAETKEKFGGQVSDLQESWNENHGTFRFKAMGFSVSGDLYVEPTVARVEINLPFAALPFKSRLEEELSGKAKALLA
ncbi:MAG: polyhydroxyalkanoic acid system family protein [Verrucomicrobiota bacterium]